MDLKRNFVSIQAHPHTAPHTICLAVQQMVSCPFKRPSVHSQSLQCSPSLPPSLPSPSLFFSLSPTEASRSHPLSFSLLPLSLFLFLSVPSSHPFLPTTPPLLRKLCTQFSSTWHVCLSLTSRGLNFTHMPWDLEKFPNVPLARWKMFNTISHQVLEIKFQ